MTTPPVRSAIATSSRISGARRVITSLSRPSPVVLRCNILDRHRMASTASGRRKERVVILGSGWAGYGFARSLDPNKFERVMISPRSYFVFTPLLAGTAVGTLEFRTVLEPVRRLGLDRFHQGWADDIDFARKTIRVEANTSDDLASKTQAAMAHRPDGDGGTRRGAMFDVEYDKLVIAIGSYSQTFGIEGVREHANFLRDVGDARRIRMKVLQSFEKAALPVTTDEERAKLLHFAIVGGGPTGIEFAAELHDLIRDDLKSTYPELMHFVRITVYDVAPKVLPMFDKKLADYAMDRFRREGISVKTEHHLTRVRPDEHTEGCLKLRIREYGDEEVSAGIVVWSTGLMQNPLLQKLGTKAFALPGSEDGTAEMQLLRDAKTGSIATDAYLRAKVAPRGATAASSGAVPLPDVYSIGDCAAVAGLGLPATAQVASQQAAHLARQLNRSASVNAGADVGAKPFRFRNWGTMTYLGGWKAIHQSSADELTGWAAWVLWRTAYLTRSMSIRNKISVPFYWAISWIFGRDISRF
ncbi:FAD/NAD(P)-binding domain-containing protein [Durotheca rogersii]|uniref:FAD/NAD(P)-binding domain-containing protein n=1 Tax=Durotheca rogersii TaxID=419775 RepID=UPI00221FE270|nr:FAD/NAD(P)-binding domain-containing protein [Durotheca rogersii]KAI5863346.1 FAD/NAD(P)-binding domain-containing protein [Durotheca rogersii]